MEEWAGGGVLCVEGTSDGGTFFGLVGVEDEDGVLWEGGKIGDR